MREFFGIGIYHGKTEINTGTLWRSACQLGASYVFIIGKRYKRQASDTINSINHIPLYEYDSFESFRNHRPKGSTLIAVEENGSRVNDFKHPPSSIYLLGAEDHGLPENILSYCNQTISIPSMWNCSYNVAVAGSIIMYDRFQKQKQNVLSYVRGA